MGSYKTLANVIACERGCKPMYNNNGLTMELVTENGNTITEFSKDGLTFVEGRKGSEYKIKITNGTWTKIKVIISVDGLDILTGQRATPNAGGYVLNAYETQVIDGWRINNDEVRKFFFTNLKSSYNAKTGNDTNNLGVIGILGYKLYVQPVIQNHSITQAYHMLNSGRYGSTILNSGKYYTPTGFSGSAYSSTIMNCSDAVPDSLIETYTAGPASGAYNKPVEEKTAVRSVGTGMGKVQESKVTIVNDTFETTPYASLMMYYKTKKELEAMGIIVAPVKSKPLPQAFAGFCKEV